MKAKILLFFFTSLLLVSGCNKYEEGSDVSLRTPKQRVCGSWSIESLNVDGADSLADFQSKAFYCNHYEFGSKDDPYGIFGYDCNSGSVSYPNLFGSWELLDDDKYLKFGIDNGIDFPYGPVFNDYIKWRIIRLANKEMWLETEYYNGKKYEIRFK